MSEQLTPEEEIEKLEAVIAGLEGLRGTLGDEAVNAQIAPLQARIGGLQQTVTQSGQLNVNIANAEGGRIRMGDMVGRDKYDVGGDMNQTDVHGDQTNVDTGGGDYKTEVHHHYAPENEDAVALRNNYLDQLLNQQNNLTLAGIDPQASSGQNGKLRLDAVYTALIVRPYTISTYDKLGGKEFRQDFENSRIISALKNLNKDNRLVLLGAPGSGKSTFVRFVAACMAGELRCSEQINLNQLTQPLPDSDELQAWGHGALLPVIVTLRELAAMKLPNNIKRGTAAQFWHYVNNKLTQPEYGKTLKHELLTHGGLLLFDGLDEVPNAAENRLFIKRMVEDVSDTFSKCRILVTSRTYAYQEEDWKLNGFDVAELQLFTTKQINFFISRWYEHVALMSRDMSSEEATDQAALLRRAIKNSERLQDFAKQPLLLTLMATLHAFHSGRLPDKRVELYEDAVRLLLNRWETQRVRPDQSGSVNQDQYRSLHEWLKVDQSAILKLLCRLAFEVHCTQPYYEKGTADIPESNLVLGLCELGRQTKQNIDQYAIIDYISQRAGLLIPYGNGAYTFPHRTFQEYLVAVYLTDTEYPYKLAELAREEPSRWREVVLLSGAKAAEGSPTGLMLLVDALNVEPDEELNENQRHQLWGGLIAGELLVESLDPDAKLHKTQRKQVDEAKFQLIATMRSDLMPMTERALAGRLLSELGDPRPGVGLDDRGIPDIEWGDSVPVGQYDYVGDGYEVETSYQLAMFPVTFAQFQAFVDAPDYGDERWWIDMPEEEEVYERNYVTKEVSSAAFPWGNHPRESVAWYQAVAFCRWLSDKLGFEVRLPHEYEWEVAVRYNDGRNNPFDKEIDESKANYNRLINQTTAVGMYPQGVQPNLNLYDLSGNVWEWCQNKRNDPAETGVDNSGESRVVRGGSWRGSDVGMRAASRNDLRPGSRGYNFGFRLCRDSPTLLHG